MSSIADLKNNIEVTPSILPQTIGVATVNGTGIDMLGYGSATLLCTATVGSVAGTVKIQESDASGSGFADAASDDVIGVNGLAVVEDNVVTLGYVGTKRYLRAVYTGTVSGDIVANFVKGNPDISPTGANS